MDKRTRATIGPVTPATLNTAARVLDHLEQLGDPLPPHPETGYHRPRQHHVRVGDVAGTDTIHPSHAGWKLLLIPRLIEAIAPMEI